MAGTFHEVLFPSNISYGSSGGPKFKTTVFTSDSGYEQRNQDWQNVRCEYDVSQAIKDRDQMAELLDFFMARRGKAFGFRYLDWLDYDLNNQQIGVGDGTTTTFQVVKTYVSAQAESAETYTYARTITKLNWGTLEGVTVGGQAITKQAGPYNQNDPNNYYTVDENTGLITFRFAPAGVIYQKDANGNIVKDSFGNPIVQTPAQTIMVGYAQFHVPVRFDEDQIDVTQEFWNTSSWPNIKIVEVRDWSSVAPS
jgi:uncharacterized protein (TIGR02217 family)